MIALVGCSGSDRPHDADAGPDSGDGPDGDAAPPDADGAREDATLDARPDAEPDARPDATEDADAVRGYACLHDGARLPVVHFDFDTVVSGVVIEDIAVEPDLPLRIAATGPDGGVELLDGAVRFRGGRLQANGEPSSRLESILRAADGITVQAWAQTDVAFQTGHIVTHGNGDNNRAYGLGQEDRDAVGRVTAGGDGSGGRSLRTLGFDVATMRHLVVRYDRSTGEQTFFLDGVASGSTMRTIGDAGASGAIAFGTAQRFGLGAEFGTSFGDDSESIGFPWDGTMHRVTVFDYALTDDEIGCLFAGGADGEL